MNLAQGCRVLALPLAAAPAGAAAAAVIPGPAVAVVAAVIAVAAAMVAAAGRVGGLGCPRCVVSGSGWRRWVWGWLAFGGVYGLLGVAGKEPVNLLRGWLALGCVLPAGVSGRAAVSLLRGWLVVPAPLLLPRCCWTGRCWRPDVSAARCRWGWGARGEFCVVGVRGGTGSRWCHRGDYSGRRRQKVWPVRREGGQTEGGRAGGSGVVSGEPPLGAAGEGWGGVRARGAGRRVSWAGWWVRWLGWRVRRGKPMGSLGWSDGLVEVG